MQNFVSEQFVLYSFQLAFVNAVPAAMPGLHEVLQLDFEGEVVQAENGDLQITLGEVKDRLTGVPSKCSCYPCRWLSCLDSL